MRNKDKGFTLIELAIGMVVLGLLLATGLRVISAQYTINNRQTSIAQLENAKEALIGYALTHGRLPRPAQSATNGLERDIACTNDAECTGLIPWEELSLPKTDIWGKIIRYSVSPEYAGNHRNPDEAAQQGSYVIEMDSQGSTNRGGAYESKVIMTIDPANTSELMRLMHAVPVVLISQGMKNWGTSVTGQALPANNQNHPDEDSNINGVIGNARAGTRFVSRVTSDATHPRGEFDDQLIWISPHVLKARLNSAGRLP